MPDVLDAPQRQHDATPAEQRLVDAGWGPFPTVWFVPETIDDERTTPELTGQLADLTSFDLSGFAQTMRQIGDLAAGDESDDYGVLRPTDFAFRRTAEVLTRALKTGIEDAIRRKDVCVFPRGSVTTDEDGGIRVEWSHQECAVRLVIPAKDSGRTYIYHEQRDDYGTTKRVTGSVLASWLQRLLVK